MSRSGLSFPFGGAREPSAHVGDQVPPLPPVNDARVKQQALEIIKDILSDSDPRSLFARRNLHELLTAHPGDPKGALLEHLIQTRAGLEVPDESAGHQESMSLNRESAEVPQTVTVPVNSEVRKRIQAVLRDKLLLTAFQPIHALPGGDVIGVEALIRFVEQDGAAADVWFREASEAGLGTELEIAALHCSLAAAEEMPQDMFVAFNLTPATSRDPRVRALLEEAHLSPSRIVIELTGSLAAADGVGDESCLGPLRRRGMRLAVSASGAGYVSMDKIEELRPDIIKLDRHLIEGIDSSHGQRIRARAVVELADELDAAVVAQGIETAEELREATELNVSAAQGYLLGRPSVHPLDWSSWTLHSQAEAQSVG
ncbi:EAL domain-containing protein [Paenarthrobacter sp. S56]|uniref:EAL domain-containing protein n=1 Tax=Paenarthrobacter sp. S56 TaxID=3138179 RepID=UPI0032191DD6